MFRPIAEAKLSESGRAAPLGFTFDGCAMTARAGDTVAAALLANGVEACRRTPVSGAPRGPYCMMGVCFECLVVIDGVGNRQGCLVPLREGMRIETQAGRRRPDEVQS
jgi:predicted molibdopterin-dependent oxidoreductase YjgC